MADTRGTLLFPLGITQLLPQLSLHTLLHKMTPNIPDSKAQHKLLKQHKLAKAA